MVRARDHTIDRRGDEAFLSLPGAVVCLMRHLLVARVRQRVLEQETALFCSGRMSFGGGGSNGVMAGAGPAALGSRSSSSADLKKNPNQSLRFLGPQCSCLSDEGLKWDDLQVSF